MTKDEIKALEEKARAAVVEMIGEEATAEQEAEEWIVKTYFLGPNPRAGRKGKKGNG